MPDDLNQPYGTTPNPVDPTLPGGTGTAPLAESQASTSGLEPNVAAGLCALVPILASLIFLSIEKKNAFVRGWATQSLYFGVATFILSVAIVIISFIFGFVPLVGRLVALLAYLIQLAIAVVWIIGVVKAFSGKVWEYPLTGPMARKPADMLSKL